MCYTIWGSKRDLQKHRSFGSLERLWLDCVLSIVGTIIAFLFSSLAQICVCPTAVYRSPPAMIVPETERQRNKFEVGIDLQFISTSAAAPGILIKQCGDRNRNIISDSTVTSQQEGFGFRPI